MVGLTPLALNMFLNKPIYVPMLGDDSIRCSQGSLFGLRASA